MLSMGMANASRSNSSRPSGSTSRFAQKSWLLNGSQNAGSPPPVNPTDSNFWTDDGPNGAAILIAAATCAEILRRPLNDPVRADQFDAIRQREETSLQEQTTRLEGPMVLQGYM